MLYSNVRIMGPHLMVIDALALVDVQPTVFGDSPPARVLSVDVVIDHHPERPGYDAVFRDIRPNYGATATILTEYIRAAGLDLFPRLATALVYGIKSDTQLLGRETSPQDMTAFAYLHASHSPALLRRIERPALPIDGLRALGHDVQHSRWGTFGHANCIEVDPTTNGFRAVADVSRNGGKAMAY